MWRSSQSLLFPAVIFDDFGITDEYNPWGIVPGLSEPKGRKTARRRKQRYRRTVEDYNPHPLGDRSETPRGTQRSDAALGHRDDGLYT